MSAPVGMKVVTKTQFWAAVMGTTANVHPKSDRNQTKWTDLRTGQLWGWSSKGYMSAEGDEVFALAQGGAA